MDDWLIPLDGLNEVQRTAIEADMDEHCIIIGPPGSGKTHVLLYRASHQINERSISSERYAIFMFTNSLKNFIKKDLDLLDLHEESVSTLDSWCFRFYKNNISKNIPREKKKGIPDFTKIKKEVLKHIRFHIEANVMDRPFDFLYLDEAQDFPPYVMELISLLASNVTVAYDSRQRVYGKLCSLSDIIKILNVDSVYELNKGYRCTKYIKDLAITLLNEPSKRTNFEREFMRVEGPEETPLLYIANDYEDERKKLFEKVKLRINNSII